jgi:hypothetical protein
MVRTRTTAEAVIGVLGPLEAPQMLLLGRPGPDGRLRVAGPLRAAARGNSPGCSRRRGGGIPGPTGSLLPARATAAHAGRLHPGQPQLVVEVDADVCWEQDRWRHATAFRRIRADLRPSDIPLAGLR